MASFLRLASRIAVPALAAAVFLACSSSDSPAAKAPVCTDVPDASVAGFGRPFTSFDSRITGDVSGSMTCAVCSVDAAVYAFDGGPTFLQIGQQNSSIVCSSPEAATQLDTNPSLGGHVQIPSAAVGTYTSDQDGADCTSFAVTFSVASFAGCPDTGEGVCDPSIQFTEYLASGTGICDNSQLDGDWDHAGVSATVVGSWSVTLTSVDLGAPDPNVTGAKTYKVHGSMTATLPAEGSTRTSGTVTLSLTF